MNENLALGFLFERTTRIIKLQFHQLFKECGVAITPEQWVVLDILDQHGTMSQKEIAKLSFKDAPSISRILDGLYNKKYIQKTTSKEDKRTSFICLTELSKELIVELKPRVRKLREQGVQNLESNEIEQLKALMNQIFMNYHSN